MSEYALQPQSAWDSAQYPRKASDPEIEVPRLSSQLPWRITYPTMPPVVSARLKAWRRILLDVKVSATGQLNHASRAESTRRIKEYRWIILPIILLFCLLAALRAFLAHDGLDANARHLDQLVRRFGHIDTHDDAQVRLGSVQAVNGAMGTLASKDQVDAEGDDIDGHHQVDGTFARLHAQQDETKDDDQDDQDNQDDLYVDTAIPRTDDKGRVVPDYREIFSLTTRDRKYFLFWFDGEAAYNPSLIPHPTSAEKYLVVAQHEQPRMAATSQQIVCTASILFGVLVCDEHPTILPVQPSINGNCQGELAWSNLRTGPRDGRMFYGPGDPYFMYGSQSSIACFGLWLQDARMILEPFRLQQNRVALFRNPAELHRPEPWHEIEKNFFLFWDSQGAAYVHHDVWPNRVYAQLEFHGGVGPDIAPLAAINDTRCMGSFMPNANKMLESIHQATNSLSITLCKRKDMRCVPTDDNTFIMHIFHHKTFYDFHAVYEPYMMLFRRNFPFEIHAISQRPYWIHGRSDLTEATNSARYRSKPSEIPSGHTESLYITSMSWRNHKQKYHGYIDDVIFLAFGIEDARSGAIDVEAGTLLQDLAYCELAMPD